jgi:hypothetical protein
VAERYLPQAEWLETAGTGAFAMGTVSRVRSRRYRCASQIFVRIGMIELTTHAG